MEQVNNCSNCKYSVEITTIKCKCIHEFFRKALMDNTDWCGGWEERIKMAEVNKYMDRQLFQDVIDRLNEVYVNILDEGWNGMARRVLDLMGRVEDAKIELDEWYEKRAKEYDLIKIKTDI